MGWNTMVIWECQLRKADIRQQTLEGIVQILDETFIKLNQPHKTAALYNQEESISQAAESFSYNPENK